MALRIVVGCCVFAAGWFVVDKVRPGLLPRIDVTGKIAALRSSRAMTAAVEDKVSKDTTDTGLEASREPELVNSFQKEENAALRSSPAMTAAVEGKDSKDTTDTRLEGNGIGEPGSATQGHGTWANNHGEEFMKHDDSIAVRAWSRVRTIISQRIMDALVPTDLQRHLQTAWTAARDAEWVQDVGYDKACLLLTSILCFVIAMCRCARGTKNTSEVEPSPVIPTHAMAVEWKSNFSISELARLNIHGYRHQGGYIYPGGNAAEQLSREDAAATVIQRWARYEFKWWLRDAKSQSSIDETSLDNPRWIDEDHGAILNTPLEDPNVSSGELGPPRGNLCSNDALLTRKRPSETKSQGGDDTEIRQDIRCQRKPSLSYAQLSQSLLRLKWPAHKRYTKRPEPVPPLT